MGVSNVDIPGTRHTAVTAPTLSSVDDENAPQDLNSAAFLVLLALASGERHGYGITKLVDEISIGRVRLPAGTLYRTITRLLSDGLVKEDEAGADPQAPHDARRRYYDLTEAGHAAARQHAQTLALLVDAATSANLVEPIEDQR